MTEPQDSCSGRLKRLYDVMRRAHVDAVLVVHDDEYLSEELSADCQRLRYLTGFTGSAGHCAVVLPSGEAFTGTTVTGRDGRELTLNAQAAVFVDGRYTVQVKRQIDPELFDNFNFADLGAAMWLAAMLPRGAKVGIDLNCVSFGEYQKIAATLSDHDITVVELARNPVDEIWEDRPAPSHSRVEIFPDEYNGCPSPQKRHDLALELRNRDLDATVICDPESICWLLNIRGRDRHCLPVVNCRLVAYANETLEWYISADHLDPEGMKQLESHVGHIDIFPDNRFDEVLERLCSSSASVFVDPDSVNAHILKKLYDGGARITEGLGLCQLPKARKNHIEIAGEYKAHVKDGVAMCRFLAWLDDLTALDGRSDTDPEAFRHRVGDTDESVLAERAESFRKVEADYIEPSFDTISAIGTNGAMVHYNYAEAGCIKALGDGPLYMIDSGAHYLDGTTDITRTILVGPGLTEEMRTMYTLVLKAHIALASVIFPKGTSGLQLDAIARKPLWDHGCDFAHGTGHGVGHLLGVHEGPQAISSHRSLVPLEPGMVISDEPGFYKEGAFGIRTENLLVVQPCQTPGLKDMLCFMPLTMVPIDTRCLDPDMLTDAEKSWLNGYHQHVRDVISNASTTLTETELNWLAKATQAI